MIHLAVFIAASLAALGFLLLAGVWRCVHTDDPRRRWYCIACVLWGKQTSFPQFQQGKVTGRKSL